MLSVGGGGGGGGGGGACDTSAAAPRGGVRVASRPSSVGRELAGQGPRLFAPPSPASARALRVGQQDAPDPESETTPHVRSPRWLVRSIRMPGASESSGHGTGGGAGGSSRRLSGAHGARPGPAVGVVRDTLQGKAARVLGKHDCM